MKAVLQKVSENHKPQMNFNSHRPAEKSQVPTLVSSNNNLSIQRSLLCPCGGGCPRCRGVIQPKLMINQPGDIYEQEADRIVYQLMAVPAHQPISAPPRIQRFSGQSNGQMQVPPSVDHALASPGRSLEPVLRQDMEQRFGHDFSSVRVHSGADAGQSARDVNANAYTVGHDIVFGEGQYSPRTLAGQRLLAHELAHTLQQAKGSAAGAERISDPRDPAEQEADRAASDAIAGQPADVITTASAHTLYRQPLPDVTLRPPPLTARLIGSELLDGFVLNSAALTEEHKGRLRILAHTLKSLLREYPGGSVQITGHTDASGEEKFNEWLGQQRADAVRDFLINAEVPVAAMASLSAGESELRIKTDKPEPRNRRVEVRFETEPKGRFFPSLEPTLPGPLSEPEKIPAPERLCIDYPELEVCRTGFEPNPPRGIEVPTRCTSTNCSAVSVDRFEKQPPDLQKVLAASFKNKDSATWWFEHLDRERRLALTSIFNRLCSYGVWCHVRLVLKIGAGEAPVLIADRIFEVPGLTPSVYFMSPSGDALIEALMATGRFCKAYGAGASQHPGQTTLREISGSDSLHVSVGPGDQFDAHIDKFSPVPEHPGSSFCSNAPSPAAVGHIGRELVPEIVRKGWRSLSRGIIPVLGHLDLAGFQVFPDFTLTPTVPQPEPATRPEAVPPPIVGITWRGPRKKPPKPLVPAEAKRISPEVGVLSKEVVEGIRRALDEQVSPDALLPSPVRVRLTEARKAADRAGPDEEAALRAARESAENESAAYTDAHDVAFDLAVRMEQARRSQVMWVKLDLERYGRYGGLDGNSRRAIVGEIRRIALILRNYLPDRAAGVNTVVVIFGNVQETIKLPGWVDPIRYGPPGIWWIE